MKCIGSSIGINGENKPQLAGKAKSNLRKWRNDSVMASSARSIRRYQRIS